VLPEHGVGVGAVAVEQGLVEHNPQGLAGGDEAGHEQAGVQQVGDLRGERGERRLQATPMLPSCSAVVVSAPVSREDQPSVSP